MKDAELNISRAVQVATETEDAANVVKETVYRYKTSSVNKVKQSQNRGRRKKTTCSLITQTLYRNVTDV